LFCDNETNVNRLYAANAAGIFKDAFHDYVAKGNHGASECPEARHQGGGALHLAGGGRWNGADSPAAFRPAARLSPLQNFADLAAARVREADEYYAMLQQNQINEDVRLVQRQAFAE
jgi:hypothetical protein